MAQKLALPPSDSVTAGFATALLLIVASTSWIMMSVAAVTVMQTAAFSEAVALTLTTTCAVFVVGTLAPSQ